MRLVRILAAFCIVAATGCGNVPEAGAKGFSDDRTVIQIVSSNVQGKNIYIPGTIIVTAGKTQTLQIYNTTEVPHGFSIAGVGVEAILTPGQETEIELSGLEGNKVHHIHCHLHPAHRSGTLVVLPGE